MTETTIPCPPSETCKGKGWEYQQYYLGDKDKENRKDGQGENHWSGAKSLEWYTGEFTRDTMHGFGDYRWRYLGPDNAFVTYEGHFYCNRMHGYGTMSYPDGRTFSGLFSNNVRWGPGVQYHAATREDVGLWRGGQLVRLSWRPRGPSIVPELMNTSTGRTIVESYRVMLTTKVKTIGDTNKALELLKQCGADPRTAVEKWNKLYPKYCTDLSSLLFFNESFDREYYKGKIYTLQEVDKVPEKQDDQSEENAVENLSTYYAWNNDNMIINMMKHSYQHEKQREKMRIDLKSILSGPRKQFKSAGNHEIDCRTLLMTAYLGQIGDVAQFINENNVHPDISDVNGNSAVMYATCGDHPDVIHFLVEAGANVNYYNDFCCTPLGIALLRYICVQSDVSPSGMIQALLPPPPVLAPPQPPIEPVVFDWNIVRASSNTPGMLAKSPSRTNRNTSSKKIKSLQSIKDQPINKRMTQPTITIEPVYDSDESTSEDKIFYNNVNREFSVKVTEVNTLPYGPLYTSYLFDVNDMVKEINACDEEQKKPPEKAVKRIASKTIKDAMKTSKELMWQSKEEISISSAEKNKIDMLTKIMNTILQLLSDGANPNLVRCPQPALLIAVISNSPELIRHLVRYGAEINEKYTQVFNYTPLDVAVSRLLTYENLEVVKALLVCGADAQHRLVHKQEIKDSNAIETQIPGPTLLHCALAKKAENDVEEDIRRQLLELLLDHNCCPTTMYKGRSALDVAMGKSIELMDVFVKNPKTDLNDIINDSNQTILVKMFTIPFFKSTITYTDRLQPFTNLLSFGADPLLKCQNCGIIYENIFVFAKNTLKEMENSQTKSVNPIAKAGKPDSKTGKKVDKPKKEERLSIKSVGRMAVDDVLDYRQALELVTDCARLIYIRWLEAQLMKNLIFTIDKYKHRHWNIILRECRDTRSIGLWLTPQRCLEIWDILSETKKKVYNDQRILRHLISIVIFMTWQNFGRLNNVAVTSLTTSIKDAIEADVTRILRQRIADKKAPSNIPSWKLNGNVKPELVKDVKKFNVCFECMLPFSSEKILCNWCKKVSFCSYNCIKSNTYRMSCHPCSDYLKSKYFPNPSEITI